MQKEDGNKNLLRPNTRNQRQQIEPRRDIENRGVRDKIYCKDAIENGGHLSLLSNRVDSPQLHRHAVASGNADQLSTINYQLPLATSFDFHFKVSSLGDRSEPDKCASKSAQSQLTASFLPLR